APRFAVRAPSKTVTKPRARAVSPTRECGALGRLVIPGLAPGVSVARFATTISVASKSIAVPRCRITVQGGSCSLTVTAPSRTWTIRSPSATYAPTPGRWRAVAGGGRWRRSHQAYAASAPTKTLTAAAASRCPNSISVGRSRGGSSRPLHSGQCSPHPRPEPVMRTMAPRMMSRYVQVAASQASRVKRRVIGAEMYIGPAHVHTAIDAISDRPLGRPPAAPAGAVECGRGAGGLDHRRRDLPHAGGDRRPRARTGADAAGVGVGRAARIVRRPHVRGAGGDV